MERERRGEGNRREEEVVVVEEDEEVVVVVVVVVEGEGEGDMYLEETCLPLGLLGMILPLSFSECCCCLDEVNGVSEMAATIAKGKNFFSHCLFHTLKTVKSELYKWEGDVDQGEGKWVWFRLQIQY